jgi:hypothetical protein
LYDEVVKRAIVKANEFSEKLASIKPKENALRLLPIETKDVEM